MSINKKINVMKTLLFILVVFTGICSLYAGIIMISNPMGLQNSLPLVLLENTPFHSFVLPGIILVIVVGGITVATVLAYLLNSKNRYNWSIASGTILSIWISLKIIIIQIVHWADFLFLAIAILIVLLAYQLKGKWAV